jgi:glutamine amidotransferase
MAAYFGPPIRLSAVLTEPAHGLVHQSYAPRSMTGGGSLSADGWGVGWFAPELGPRPGVIRGTRPIWSDENVAGAAHAIASGAIVAVVRGASPGLGVSPYNTPPYVIGAHLFAHNGHLRPWAGSLARALRGRLDPRDEAEVRGTTDSELLGALWRSHARRTPDPSESLRAALRDVRDEAHRLGGQVSANLLVADLAGLLAVRFADPGPAPTLHVRRSEGGVWVASEPLDDADGWREVPSSTLLRIDAEGVHPEPFP